MRIDLHTHSTASDGTDTPAELVLAGIAANLDVLAITDHDTTSGWQPAMQELESSGSTMQLVRGIELSCSGRGEDGKPVPVHLLGYLFDPSHQGFADERARLRVERETRLRAMVAKFNADGIMLDADAILSAAGPSVGRPLLARQLIALGVVSRMDEAFAGPLKTGGKYYVDKVDTDLDAGVKLITDAGGAAVIAHARARTRGRLLAADHIEELAAAGALVGLEVDHPDHNDTDRAWLRDVAERHGLVVTGSSDYHGTNKTTPLGANTTAPDQFEALVERTEGVPCFGR